MNVSSNLPKKVMHITTSLDFGGVETHLNTIAQNSEKLSYRHVFCAIGEGGQVEREMRDSGVPVSCLNARTKSPSASAFIRIFSHIRAERPDVVHTHGAEANFHALPVARVLGIPVRVGEEIGIPNHGRRARLAFRWAYRCAHAVVGVSKAVADRIIELGEAPSEKVSVIYPPIRLPALSPDEKDRNSLTLIYVGRLHPIKNPRVLIPVLRLLRDEGIPARMWYVGDGPEMPILRRMAEENELIGNITFHGFKDNVDDLLAQADILVQPSLSEGLPFSIVEAMAAGLPVVVTKYGGTNELVVSGWSGFLVEPTDPVEITNAIKECWSAGHEGRKIMGENARNTVEELFDIESNLRKLEELYRAVWEDNKEVKNH